MKNFMLLKSIFFFTILLSSFSAAGINGPVRSNWLNSMAGGAPESFQGPQVYVLLDEENSLSVNLIVTTTDNDVESYDPVFIEYSFGPNQSGMTEQVEQGDLVQISPGVFEAVYFVRLGYNEECGASTTHLLYQSITIALKTPKFGGFDDYPMEQNAGLFNPSLYNEYYSQFTTNKIFVCWDAPPINMTGNNDDQPNTIHETQPTLNQSLQVKPQVKNENEIQTISAQPNPFVNEFSLHYKLDAPSDVQIQVINLQGKQVALENKLMQDIGSHNVSIIMEDDIPCGLYTVLIRYSEKTEAIKLIKLKAFK